VANAPTEPLGLWPAIQLKAAMIAAISGRADKKSSDVMRIERMFSDESTEWFEKNFVPKAAGVADEIERHVRKAMGLSSEFPYVGQRKVAEQPSPAVPTGEVPYEISLADVKDVVMGEMTINDEGTGMSFVDPYEPVFPHRDEMFGSVNIRMPEEWEGEPFNAVAEIAMNIVGLVELARAYDVEPEKGWWRELDGMINNLAKVATQVMLPDTKTLEEYRTNRAEDQLMTIEPKAKSGLKTMGL